MKASPVVTGGMIWVWSIFSIRAFRVDNGDLRLKLRSLDDIPQLLELIIVLLSGVLAGEESV